MVGTRPSVLPAVRQAWRIDERVWATNIRIPKVSASD